ncbi:S1 family peptidase [bacterium]|nr:S1 family peptidase [bacterium]
MNRFGGFSLIAFSLIVAISGCGHKLSENDLPRPSSRLATATQNFPGIVMISSPQVCTATIVGPSTLLTAAHCVNQGRPVTIQTSEGAKQSSDIVLLGSGVEGDPHDLALVYLSSPFLSQQTILPVASGANPGDQVLVVGYGCASSEAVNSTGIKRLGSNVVSDVNDFVEVSTPGVQIRAVVGPENRAGVCFGDSGGPLLKQVGGQWAVVGVAHGAYNEAPGQVSQFVNLNHPGNRAFLSQYIK